MKKHLCRTATLALVPALSLAGAGCSTQPMSAPSEDTVAKHSAKQGSLVEAAFPSARIFRADAETTMLFGPSLAAGDTPEKAAGNFARSYVATLGLDEGDLIAQDVAPKKAAQTGDSGIGLMYDQETGQPKFWLYRHKQNRQGLRVFRARLDTLVRNDGSNAVVWASSSLRDLRGFAIHGKPKKRDPHLAKSLEAIQALSDGTADPRPLFTDRVTFSEPESIIFAGSENADTAPVVAIEYNAETIGAGTWHLVADADTGDILHIESLDVFATVTGTVHGYVTQGDNAMGCSYAARVPLPYAEIDGLPGEQTFTDANGVFALDTSAEGSLNVSSPVSGRYFNIQSNSRPPEQLFSSLTPPAVVAFIHASDVTDEALVAQANAYSHANDLRLFLLRYIPTFATISTEVGFPINVNLTSATDFNCPGKAHYDGTAINCCLGTDTYANTAFASLIRHEYAHHIIKNGGGGTGAYGEGMADAITSLFSGQHEFGIGLSRGQCTTPIRDAANICQFSTNNGSSCGKEIHQCGQLLSGAIWSIRKELSVTHPNTYVDIINNLTLNSIHLHTDDSIDSTIAHQFLVLDDLDGNLDNGTPHYSEICAGFAAHGLTCPALKTDMAVNPSAGLSAQGAVGGPFAPTKVTYTVTNLGPTSSLQYQVAPVAAAPWIAITNATGLLARNQSAQVTLSINPSAAAGLPKGNYTASVRFTNRTNGVGNTVRPVQLLVGTPQVIYTEDFESGLGTFAVDPGPTNLWHVSTGCNSALAGHSRPRNLYFGLDATCNYSDGGSHLGSVTSTAINLTDASLAKLQFNYFLGTENLSIRDQAWVQVSINDGIFWTLASNTTDLSETQLQDGAGTWQIANFDLTPYLAGLSSATLRIRFLFDTIDKYNNNYPGFLVDDVKVIAFAGGVANKPPTVSAGENQSIALPAAASLVGIARDDGQPNPPGRLTTTWSKVSGPGSVNFANPGTQATTATFSTAGTYTLRLTASDGALSASSDVVITVAPSLTPCSGLCDHPVNVTVNGSFQSGNIGSGAICYQTTSIANGGNCGNFVSPRTLSVNGMPQTCNYLNWPSMPPKRNGGYCIQTTPGDYFYAYVVLFY